MIVKRITHRETTAMCQPVPTKAEKARE